MGQDAIAQEMRRLTAENEMAGAALIVRRGDAEIYRGQWGCADIEGHVPATVDTIYRLASMSKPVTAVAVMQLVAAGRLQLNQPLTDFVPEYAHMRVLAEPLTTEKADALADAGQWQSVLTDLRFEKSSRVITIRDLLTHSAGIGMGVLGNRCVQHLSLQGDDLAARVARWAAVPLDFQPGTQTGYSAIAGFDILGRVVEIVSGVNFATYVRTQITEPAGIHDLVFVMDEEQKSRLARLYETENGEQHEREQEICPSANATESGYFSGSAGMMGSCAAYAEFVRMLANNGRLNGREILSAETVYAMHTQRAPKTLYTDPGTRWGLGMIVYEAPEKIGSACQIGTYGWSGAYGTHFFIDPARHLQATFMMNRTNIGGSGSPIARAVERLVFGIFSD